MTVISAFGPPVATTLHWLSRPHASFGVEGKCCTAWQPAPFHCRHLPVAVAGRGAGALVVLWHVGCSEHASASSMLPLLLVDYDYLYYQRRQLSLSLDLNCLTHRSGVCSAYERVVCCPARRAMSYRALPHASQERDPFPEPRPLHSATMKVSGEKASSALAADKRSSTELGTCRYDKACL